MVPPKVTAGQPTLLLGTERVKPTSVDVTVIGEVRFGQAFTDWDV
jgi:hypothetical protein